MKVGATRRKCGSYASRLGSAVCALALLATTMAACGGSTSTSSRASLAAHLRQLNPGARIGGSTLVGTATGQHLMGQSGPNFMLALGPNETIVGGPGNDELGAQGANATITGGSGNDQLFGGTGSTLVGGSGHDLLVDTKNDATIRVMSSGNEVVASGNHDHVVCALESLNDTIYANPSDSIDPRCQLNNARILPATGALASLRLTSADLLAGPSGTGSSEDPYVAPCDPNAFREECKVPFPSRELHGLWTNEYVPAYKCPSSNPYLINFSYAPFLTSNGLEVALDNVGISITGFQVQSIDSKNYLIGTKTGFPNSSASSWTFGYAHYQMNLHCTKDLSRAAFSTGGGPL